MRSDLPWGIRRGRIAARRCLIARGRGGVRHRVSAECLSEGSDTKARMPIQTIGDSGVGRVLPTRAIGDALVAAVDAIPRCARSVPVRCVARRGDGYASMAEPPQTCCTGPLRTAWRTCQRSTGAAEVHIVGEHAPTQEVDAPMESDIDAARNVRQVARPCERGLASARRTRLWPHRFRRRDRHVVFPPTSMGATMQPRGASTRRCGRGGRRE